MAGAPAATRPSSLGPTFQLFTRAAGRPYNMQEMHGLHLRSSKLSFAAVTDMADSMNRHG